MEFNQFFDGFLGGKFKKEKILELVEQLKQKKSKSLEDLIKLTSQALQQISDSLPNVPEKLEKIQTAMQNEWSNIHFASSSQGIDSKLSAFKGLKIDEDSRVDLNQVVGNYWFGVCLTSKANLEKNQFKGVHFSEVTINQSNLTNNEFFLSRLSNISLSESRWEGGKLAFSAVSDFSLTESDFTNCLFKKAELARTVVNGSRLSNLEFAFTTITECEFDRCDIQGITFENCSLDECTFEEVEVITTEPKVIQGLQVKGKHLKNIRSYADLLAALESPQQEVNSSEGPETTPDTKSTQMANSSPTVASDSTPQTSTEADLSQSTTPFSPKPRHSKSGAHAFPSESKPRPAKTERSNNKQGITKPVKAEHPV